MKNINKILVIDVESTCWEEQNHTNISEIIEIGITEIQRIHNPLLNSSKLSIRNTRSFPVYPWYSEVSEFCTKLTGWTKNDLDMNGTSYKNAIDLIKKEYGTNWIFASWGNYDRSMFERMDELHMMKHSFPTDHLNVKILFATKFGKRGGLSEILNELNIPFTGIPHRGFDDSYMIAKILLEILYS